MRNNTRLPESASLLQRCGRCARVCTCFILIIIIILFSKMLLFFHDFNGLHACVRVCVCLSSSRPPSSLGWLAVWCAYCPCVCMCVYVCMCACAYTNNYKHTIYVYTLTYMSVYLCTLTNVYRWQGAMGRHLSIRDVVRRKSITRRQ
jgi:hypothetical protein